MEKVKMSLANVNLNNASLDSEFWQDECGHWCHCTSEFCLKCLSEEDKWRLNVI